MIIFISVLILIAAVLSLSRICFRMAFSADDSIRNVHRRIPSREQYQKYRETTLRYIDELESLPCESVSVISCDGLKLTGRYYEGDDSLPLAVCIHGYKSTGIRDFAPVSGFSENTVFLFFLQIREVTGTVKAPPYVLEFASITMYVHGPTCSVTVR